MMKYNFSFARTGSYYKRDTNPLEIWRTELTSGSGKRLSKRAF